MYNGKFSQVSPYLFNKMEKKIIVIVELFIRIQVLFLM